MLAPILIPLIFIVGLFMLFALGAWPYGLAAGAVALMLLVAVGLGLGRYVRTPAR